MRGGGGSGAVAGGVDGHGRAFLQRWVRASLRAATLDTRLAFETAVAGAAVDGVGAAQGIDSNNRTRSAAVFSYDCGCGRREGGQNERPELHGLPVQT